MISIMNSSSHKLIHSSHAHSPQRPSHTHTHFGLLRPDEATGFGSPV